MIVVELQLSALNKYVNAVADLAELLQADISGDGYISNETILALNDVVLAAHELEEVFAAIDEMDSVDKRNLN